MEKEVNDNPGGVYSAWDFLLNVTRSIKICERGKKKKNSAEKHYSLAKKLRRGGGGKSCAENNTPLALKLLCSFPRP